MRIHHLNCISECALGGALLDGRTLGLRACLSVHCLAVESSEGLILVDTGFGLGDVRSPRTRLSKFFLFMNDPDFRESMTAVRQLEALGYRPEDVRHVVMTHLDFDHAGGIEDFPQATVHLLLGEQEAALRRWTTLDRMRYRPQQWSGTRARWHAYVPGEGETWFGFSAVRALEGLSDEIALVPLVGHTLGHAGVAVHGEAGWLLLAGDAYFWHGEMDADRPRCTPGLRLYQWMMQKDGAARRWNQRRLRGLKSQHGAEVRLICSHDPIEFERMSGRKLGEPLPAREPVLTEPPRDESVLF
ncbi:MAG TPA: MBL fold metallo-hydrolase [Myxococcaceae bacterium]|jgi:glyoxylase-like metal-dependent hydrolase (beta-lactamase superfamily II)